VRWFLKKRGGPEPRHELSSAPRKKKKLDFIIWSTEEYQGCSFNRERGGGFFGGLSQRKGGDDAGGRGGSQLAIDGQGSLGEDYSCL